MVKRIWMQNKRFLIGLCFAFCLLCTVALGLQMQPVASANTSGSAGYSFSHMSEAAAQFLNQTQDPVHGATLPSAMAMRDGTDASSKYWFGNAGGLLGYQDEWEDGASFTISGTGSGNTVVYYYNTLRDNISIEGNTVGSGIFASIIAQLTGRTDPTTDQFSGYGYYGYALSELGLDETAMTGANTSMRQILGIVMLALYALSTSVDLFFNLIFALLRFANPFRLFLGAGSVLTQGIGNTVGPILDNSNTLTGEYNPVSGNMIGSDATMKTAITTGLTSLINLVTGFYNALYKFSSDLILPLLLAFALFTWLVVKKGTGFWSVFRPFIVKITFIVLGVPLMFAAYSAALDTVYDFTAVENTVSSRVVMTTFFDFEKWVYNNRLALRDTSGPMTLSVEIDADGTVSLSDSSVAQMRSYLARLNQANYADVVGTFTMPTFGGSSIVEQMHDYNTTMLNGGSVSLHSISSSTLDTNVAFLTAVTNMLQRYTNSSVVSAASYQSYVTSKLLSDATNNDDMKKAIFAEYSVCQNWMSFHPELASSFKYKKGDGAVGTGIDNVDLSESDVQAMASARFAGGAAAPANMKEVQLELWSSGGLMCGSVALSASGGLAANGGASTSSRMAVMTLTQDASHDYGMSAMAMYNYLSSAFDESKITVYSAANTTSDQVQIGHYSVTTVGTGLMKWIYLIDAIVLLGCSVVLGYGYGLSLLIANFKALFKMIPNVLTGMMGSLRGIASALALTAALIVEVLGTCILYGVAMQIVYALYTAVEAPLVFLIDAVGDNGALNVAFGALLPVLFGVISIALIFTITMKLLQWRVAICQSTTEACTSFINKFIGTNVTAPNLHDGMSLANAGSIAASAMLAAGMLPDDAKNEIKSRADDIREGLTGAAGSGSLTGGTGGILEDKDDDAEMTKEEREQLENGVKLGNGTGETPGKEDTETEAPWGDVSVDGDVDTSGSSMVSADGSSTSSNTNKNLDEMSGEAGADGASGTKGDGTRAANANRAGAGAVDGDVDEGSVTAHVGGEVDGTDTSGLNGEAGYNADAAAANYVDQNREEFEAAIQDAVAQNQGTWNEARMNDPGYQAKLAAQEEAASRKTVMDTNGVSTSGLQVVNAETGEAYTQADKDAGAAFTVQNQNGEVYVDSNGQAYDHMSADNVQLDSNGKVSSISDGQGNTSAVSDSTNPQKLIVDSNGVGQGQLQVVNAETGEAYTQVDKDSGAAYTVLDKNGQVYVDSNGTAYEGMDAKNIKIDGATGQVAAIRDTQGNISTVMANDTQARAVLTNTETGERTAGVQVVNASTGETYTAQDQRNGEAFSVITKDGTAYVDSSGATMINQPSTDVSIDTSTGQVNGVRNSAGTISSVQTISSDSTVTVTGGGAAPQSTVMTYDTHVSSESTSKAIGDDPNTTLAGTMAVGAMGGIVYATGQTMAAAQAAGVGTTVVGSAPATNVVNSQTTHQSVTTQQTVTTQGSGSAPATGPMSTHEISERVVTGAATGVVSTVGQAVNDASVVVTRGGTATGTPPPQRETVSYHESTQILSTPVDSGVSSSSPAAPSSGGTYGSSRQVADSVGGSDVQVTNNNVTNVNVMSQVDVSSGVGEAAPSVAPVMDSASRVVRTDTVVPRSAPSDVDHSARVAKTEVVTPPPLKVDASSVESALNGFQAGGVSSSQHGREVVRGFTDGSAQVPKHKTKGDVGGRPRPKRPS